VLACTDIEDVALPVGGCANDVLCPVGKGVAGAVPSTAALLRRLALEVFGEYQRALWDPVNLTSSSGALLSLERPLCVSPCVPHVFPVRIESLGCLDRLCELYWGTMWFALCLLPRPT
jgi:hypothetical protein